MNMQWFFPLLLLVSTPKMVLENGMWMALHFTMSVLAYKQLVPNSNNLHVKLSLRDHSVSVKFHLKRTPLKVPE